MLLHKVKLNLGHVLRTLRARLQLSKRLSVAIGLLLLFTQLSCNRYGVDEVAQALSPDGKLEAIVQETNGGATTSFGYVISIKQSSGGPSIKAAALYGAARSAEAYGCNISWISNNELHVQYLQAKAVTYHAKQIEADHRIILVMLDSGFEDRSAPPGGMLYNLHKQR